MIVPCEEYDITKDMVRVAAESVNSSQELLTAVPAQTEKSLTMWDDSMVVMGNL